MCVHLCYNSDYAQFIDHPEPAQEQSRPNISAAIHADLAIAVQVSEETAAESGSSSFSGDTVNANAVEYLRPSACKISKYSTAPVALIRFRG